MPKFALQPGVLCRGCATCRRQEWCNKVCCSRSMLQRGLGRCCFTWQCSFATSALRYGTPQQRWNRARCNADTMHLYVAKVPCMARRCAGKRVERFYVAMVCIDASYVANGCIEVDSSVMGCTEVSRQACCNILCCGTFCMFRWRFCKTSAVHPLLL